MELIYLASRIIHLIGFAIGIGGSTSSDTLFFRSLKDRKISSDELNLLKILSKLMWVGLFLLILSGISFLYISKINTGAIPLLQDPRFLAKLTIVGIIFLNGLVFHIFIIPFLTKNADNTLSKENLGSKLYLLAISGGISIVSWYSVLFIALLRMVDMSYLAWMGIYAFLVFCAIIGGFIILNKKLGLG